MQSGVGGLGYADDSPLHWEVKAKRASTLGWASLAAMLLAEGMMVAGLYYQTTGWLTISCIGAILVFPLANLVSHCSATETFARGMLSIMSPASVVLSPVAHKQRLARLLSVVPSRISDELLGDALEHTAAMRQAGASEWSIHLFFLGTLLTLVQDVIRFYVTKRLRSKSR